MADEELVDSIVFELDASAKGGEFDAEITAMCDEVIELWRSNSPEDSGEYKASIQMIRPADGGTAEVAATVEYANIIEYGSVDTPEFAPMRKTVEQMNRRLGAQ